MVLPENAYNLTGSVQAIYVENHAEEDVEICVGQKIGRIHSLQIDKEAWLKAELGSENITEVSSEDQLEGINEVHESEYDTEEKKRRFIKESFQIDENEILHRDAQLKEEVIKML